MVRPTGLCLNVRDRRGRFVEQLYTLAATVGLRLLVQQKRTGSEPALWLPANHMEAYPNSHRHVAFSWRLMDVVSDHFFPDESDRLVLICLHVEKKCQQKGHNRTISVYSRALLWSCASVRW